MENKAQLNEFKDRIIVKTKSREKRVECDE